MKGLQGILFICSLAVVTVVLAATVMMLGWPWLQPTVSPLFFVAVMISAWYGRSRAGLVTALLSVPVINYLFIVPRYTLKFDLDDIIRAGIFLFVSLLISLLVAQLKRAEEAKRDSDRWLAITLKSIGDAVIATNDQGRIVFVNAVAQRLTGYTEAEAQGRELKEVFHIINEETREPVESPVAKVLRTGNIVGLANHTILIAKNGAEIPIDDSGAPIKDERGQITGVVLVFRDIIERHRAEQDREKLLKHEQELRQKAEEAQRGLERINIVKDEFLATVSHELRTPLTAMLGWARLLRSGKLDNQGLAHALATIERNAVSQAQLIEDLLDISRIITGKLRLDKSSAELVAIVSAAIDSVRPAATAKNITIRVELAERNIPILADSTRIQQVVWNILTNAIKFTPYGGKITIEVGRSEAEAEIRVTDTGQGISADFLPYVFDRFQQADSSTTRIHGGLGLGLAIVRHLVELHGGSVKAESAGQGQGATFTVTLPCINTVSVQDSDYTDTDGAAISADVLAGLRLLVVDDEFDTRDLLTLIFQQYGAEVRTAASAVQALDAFDAWRPDILVTDIGMPGEDGYSLLKKLRALENAQGRGHIPALALTAYAKPEDRVRALSAGFQIYMSKPIEPTELVALVANLAGRIGDMCGAGIP